MKAWLLDDFAGLSKLRLVDHPDPRASANEVVLDIQLAALNPADRYLSEALYPAKPPLPHILGRDGIGTISEIGAGVTGFRIGDQQVVLRGDVGVNRAGTFAQRVAVPIESLIPKPDGWSDEESAGAALVYITAHQALTQWGDLPKDSVVLVTGASGGVGVASVQLAAAMGCFVVALSRDVRKRAKLQAIGANLVVDPQDANWRKSLRDSLGKRRVDLAIDNVGGQTFNDVLDSLGMWGKISVVGRVAGPVPQFNTASLIFRRVRIGGVQVASYTNTECRAAWSAILSLLAKTRQKPLVDSVFDFDKLPDAFDRLEKGPMGKLLLKVK